MKQLFTTLSLAALLLCSCSKETSFERQCGTITAIHASQREIILDGNTPVRVTLQQLTTLQVGDTFCR